MGKAIGSGYRRERIDRGIKVRSESIFIVSSYRDMLYPLLPRVLPVVALFILPLVLGGGYWGRVIFMCCIYGLLALSWDFLASVGLVSLGHALFFGVGSYVAGALDYYLGLSVPVTILLGTLGGAVISTGLLAPSVRLRGIYFAMISFAFPLLCPRIIEATKILGGTLGLPNLTPFPSVYLAMYLGVVILLVCLFAFRRLINADYGTILAGIRDNDRAVMSGGVNIYWYKIQALFIASVVGSFAGALATHYWQFVGISAFSWDFSILPLAGVILGGPGTFAGALTGTFILVIISEFLREFAGLRIVIYSVILAGAVIGLPEGIFHYIQRKYHQMERWVRI